MLRLWYQYHQRRKISRFLGQSAASKVKDIQSLRYKTANVVHVKSAKTLDLLRLYDYLIFMGMEKFTISDTRMKSIQNSLFMIKTFYQKLIEQYHQFTESEIQQTRLSFWSDSLKEFHVEAYALFAMMEDMIQYARNIYLHKRQSIFQAGDVGSSTLPSFLEVLKNVFFSIEGYNVPCTIDAFTKFCNHLWDQNLLLLTDCEVAAFHELLRASGAENVQTAKNRYAKISVFLHQCEPYGFENVA